VTQNCLSKKGRKGRKGGKGGKGANSIAETNVQLLFISISTTCGSKLSESPENYFVQKSRL